MGLETERKFLVDKKKWSELAKPTGEMYRQGYLLADPVKTIRARMAEKSGFLTIKGKTEGASRAEYEYAIPLTDAKELIDRFSVSEVTKKRYKISVDHKVWDVDEFLGDNEGLILAEIELQNENEPFTRPAWVTTEVTTDKRYYNAYLSMHPYKTWK